MPLIFVLRVLFGIAQSAPIGATLNSSPAPIFLLVWAKICAEIAPFPISSPSRQKTKGQMVKQQQRKADSYASEQHGQASLRSGGSFMTAPSIAESHYTGADGAAASP